MAGVKLQIGADGAGIGGELDIELLLGRLQDRWQQRLMEYKRSFRTIPRHLFGVQQVPATGLPPWGLVVDMGQITPGLVWLTQQAVLFVTDPVTGIALPATTVQVNQAGTGAASAIVLTVPAVAGQTNQVSGFTITGDGATTGSIIVVTLAGVQGGTQSFDLTIPAGVGTSITPLVVTFNPPLLASGPGVAITLTVPSFGAGNTNAAAELEAQVTSGGPVSAAVFKGQIPPAGQASDSGQCVVPSLSVPTSNPIAIKVVVQGMEHLYAVFKGSGLVAGVQAFANADVLEAVDQPETLSWL